MRIASGTTDQYIYFVAVDATDFTTRETGLSSFTVYRSRNGAAAAAMTTPTVNETDSSNMPGVYELLLDEDMTIGSGNDTEEMVFHITASGMAPVTRTIELYRPKITTGNTLSVESDGDLTEVNTLTGHTAQTGDSYARLGAPAGASVSADIATVDGVVDDILVDTGTTLPGTLSTMDGKLDTIDGIVDDILVDTGTTLQGELDGIQADTEDLQTQIGTAGAGLTAVPWNSAWDAEVQSECADALTAYDAATGTDVSGLNDPTAAAIADAVWDEATTGHTTAGTFGEQAATDIDAILADTNELQTDDIPGSLSSIASAIETVDDFVDTEVAAILALLDDPRSEPGQGAPPVNPDLATKIDYLYKAFRNRKTQTATTWSLFDDAGTTVDQKSTVSDNGTTAEFGEVVSGP